MPACAASLASSTCTRSRISSGWLGRVASLAPPEGSDGTERLLPRCRFPSPGTGVACAVSGGPDSMALMVLAVAAGLEVEAVHVDHGLRDGSAAEAGVVAAAAERFGATFRSVRSPVAAGANVEARARAARYAALPPGVLTGHTADDQAETMVLNLLRGAGLDGLAGIRASTRRPLLALRRHETATLCHDLGLEVVDDPSNRDPSIRRNEVRHRLLPLASEVAERDVVPVIARQAELLRDEADLLDGLAAAIDVTDAQAVAEAPVALARRAVRRWIAAYDDERHPPDLAAVDRVLAVARGEVTACEVAGGVRIARTAGRLRVERPTP
ncbi:MAG TPA: tRNA lysidine(34) synthetase TilS [Acidimicrobiales bacterium]|nr:tRNA lysidine(34) synthetase TilS [Acidimicrobiales bacterium]